MRYELIDHTADIGIRVAEPTVKELFETAAHALYAQIADTSRLEGRQKKSINITGIDTTDLLINWLRELLWCWTIDSCLVKQTEIIEMSETELRAMYTYDEFIPQDHEILKDVKAVTYHGALVEEAENGWMATVIFDV